MICPGSGDPCFPSTPAECPACRRMVTPDGSRIPQHETTARDLFALEVRDLVKTRLAAGRIGPGEVHLALELTMKMLIRENAVTLP